MRVPISKPDSVKALFEQVGGQETCHRLSHAFHERVGQDDELRKIFPKNLLTLSEHFALFITERLGGPAAYTAKRGKQSLVCRHAHLSISTDESERWLGHMFAAIDDVEINEPSKSILRDYFVETAKTLTDPFLPLYQLPLNLLTARLKEEPELLGQSPAGHSLLRDAAMRWDAKRVQVLLESGADPNSEELLGHGPLYRAVNAEVPGSEEEGKQVVQLLIQFGADVNKPSGPGKSTPLHVTARRGHVFLAEILLKAGAIIESRDNKGETPLRRAVNCRQEAMVVFLLSKGASPRTRDKNGLTPLDATKSEVIRSVLGRKS